ncbi:hypothetical protein FQA39_LY18082 [Lamprigera yunnana]|nr:hypothetical protein FQA39_LY18082 [Lamprigera yunnana]
MWMLYAEQHWTKAIDLKSAVERLYEKLGALEFDADHEEIYGMERYYTVQQREELRDKYKIGRKMLATLFVCIQTITMPFFSNKFSPAKSKIRKSTSSLNTEDVQDLLQDNRHIKLNLGQHEANFIYGNWKIDSNQNVIKRHEKNKIRIQELEEENNLLKIKVEILLNMLTQTNADSQKWKSPIGK